MLKNSCEFLETPVERRATMEVEDANPSCDAPDRESIMEMETYVQRSERIRSRSSRGHFGSSHFQFEHPRDFTVDESFLIGLLVPSVCTLPC